MIVIFKFVLVSISLIALSKAKSDEEAFAELVPSIFDAPPTSVASVIYPDGSSANLGNKLEYDTILPQPVIFWDADPEVFYTLVIIDVDAPKPPGATAFIHFAINNIIGTDLETGYTIYPYFPTIPAPGTGPHRYVQLVYQQDSKIENKRVDTALNNVEDGDRATNYKKFLERYELKLIAWNFFTAGTTLSVYSF